MSTDLRSLIADRLAAADRYRADAPKRREEAHKKYLEQQLERKRKEAHLLHAAIKNARVLDYTFSLDLVPDSDDIEYVGVRNEHLGNFGVVKTWKIHRDESLMSLSLHGGMFGIRFRVVATRATYEDCIQAMLEQYGVEARQNGAQS